MTLFTVAEGAAILARVRERAEQITADTFVLAAGSRPRLPDVPGFEDFATRIHTSDSVMRMQHLPKSMIIIGGGFVAAEFAHIFTSFGTDVTLLQRSDVLLKREDADIAQAFTEQLAQRVNVRLKQTVVGLEYTDRNTVIVESVDPDGIHYDFEAERVLLAVGLQGGQEAVNVAGFEEHAQVLGCRRHCAASSRS